jgi:hypothetical protein
VKLGAKGGVSYKDKDWDKKLVGLLPSDRKYLDAIVDGAGGDIVNKGSRLLKVHPPLPLLLNLRFSKSCVRPVVLYLYTA